MSIPSDYRDIVFGLMEATESARVNWYIERHDVQVKLDDTIVKLWAGVDEESDVPFVSFALSDFNGRMIDTWFLDQGSEDYDYVFKLYSDARRMALGIPQKLDNLRALLKGGGIVGSPPVNVEKDDEVPF